MVVLESRSEGIILSVRLQPKAAKNGIAGIIGDSLKVKVSSPPVEGAANEACCEILARVFRIPKGRVQIISGFTSRQKKVLLAHMDKETAESRLNDALERGLK